MLLLPGPTDIPQESYEAMARKLINHRSREFRELHQDVIECAKEVLQTKSDVFVLTCSGTGGIEAAVANLLDRHDRVLVFRNGQFAERMGMAAENYSDSVIYYDLTWGTAPNRELVESALSKVGSVDVVLIVHNETSTGALVRDLPEVAEVCKDHGAYVIVDGITSVGGVEFKFDQIDVDLVVTATQKCLAGPPGLSIIGVKEEAWEKIARKRKRPYYFDLILHKEFMERGETPFTPAIPLFYGLRESLRHILQTGIDRWIDRHRRGANAYYAAIRMMELEAFSASEFLSPTLIAVKMPNGIKDVDVAGIMAKKFDVHVGVGVSHTKGKVLRIGNMGMVTPERVERGIAALVGALNELGYDRKIDDVNDLVSKSFK